MARARHYLAWQSRLILPELGQRVVEVGCGTGNFTGQLLNRKMVIALDPELECIEHLRARYPDQPNLRVLVSDPCSASFADLARFRPDSCVCSNVLEHIQDDRHALAAMADILEPGGKIVLWVPAFQALYGPMDRRLDHYRRYRRTDLIRLAAQTGLDLKKIHYVNFVGFFLWWASAHILRQESLTEAQIDIFDQAVAPWLSRLEAVLPPPFGQSLFAVLEKR
jgi:SAM-dependent methyltransferase